MSFITIQFALFVSITLLVYYIVPSKVRWVCLLLASYVFYCFTGAINLLYIMFTTVTTFVSALALEKKTKEQKVYLSEHKQDLTKEEKKLYKSRIKSKQRLILSLCLILNFGILVYLKYANLCIAYFNLFRLNTFGNTNFISFIDVFLPLGISFYTFQSMGYLIDIYYGKYEAEKNVFKFALYVSFFPQIIQGPISRFAELSASLYEGKQFDFYNIKSGFYRVMWGLFKKLVIADRLSAYVSTVIDGREIYNGFYIVLAVFFYSMEIYGDFSGGIDVTIGVAQMFGVTLTENFERPFFSKSISEYWRRWHITLGTWFKDYIFYPLSINKSIIKFGKWVRAHINDTLGKKIPIYLPMVIVWATTGMWHGSEARYVVWGLLNCVFIILETELEPVSLKLVEKFKLNEAGFLMRFYRVFKTFWLMAFLRLFDISKDVPSAFNAFRLIFKPWSSFSLNTVFENLSLSMEDFYVAIIAILIVFVVSLLQRRESIRSRIFKLPVCVQWIILGTLIVAVSVFGIYGPGYDAKAFIYLQF